jgi:hypothetical protein
VLVARSSTEAVSSNAIGDPTVKLAKMSSTKWLDFSNILMLVIKNIIQGTCTGIK